MTIATMHDPQKFLNGEIHDWYRIILGYPDHLVSSLLDQFKIEPGQEVLDPFCGTGTTLIECMKKNISCTGIEANPSSYFAARVKTNWGLEAGRLLAALRELRLRRRKYFLRKQLYRRDPTYRYLEESGMIARGWISNEPLRKSIAVKNCIADLNFDEPYKDALMLALIAEVVRGAANIKFGPEVYCGEPKDDADVFEGVVARVEQMASDLEKVAGLSTGFVQLMMGDSRNCKQLLRGAAAGPYHAIISSPPYPTEHDYTRNSRLELAFLEKVPDRSALQSIKKMMIRSNTKGIYKDDDDRSQVKGNREINILADQLSTRAAEKTYGFARLYSVVIREYFGGMKRHFKEIRDLLVPNGLCAYVVGDQSSYLQVHIPTAEILSSLAEEVGFKTVDVVRWRRRWSTKTSKAIDENILVLRNADKS